LRAENVGTLGCPEISSLGFSRKWAAARFFYCENEWLGSKVRDIKEDINMKGIQFVIDETGKKKAVVIDLAEWGEIWEDIYDVLVSQSRKDEPTVDWEDLKAEMTEEAKAGRLSD